MTKVHKKMSQNLDVTRQHSYVMCDSERLSDPLKRHNKIQKTKNELSLYFNSILTSNSEAKN